MNVSSSKQAVAASALCQLLIPQVSSFLAEAPWQYQGQQMELLLPQQVLHLKWRETWVRRTCMASAEEAACEGKLRQLS